MRPLTTLRGIWKEGPFASQAAEYGKVMGVEALCRQWNASPSVWRRVCFCLGIQKMSWPGYQWRS